MLIKRILSFFAKSWCKGYDDDDVLLRKIFVNRPIKLVSYIDMRLDPKSLGIKSRVLGSRAGQDFMVSTDNLRVYVYFLWIFLEVKFSNLVDLVLEAYRKVVLIP